jgi:ABC-type phosphate/phosphonate transport system substrate-binding protein
MEHPFVTSKDLEDKTIEEIQDAMSNLMNKLTFAYRTQNGPMIHQLQMVLESHRTQYYKKMDEVFAKQKLNSQINIQSDR